MKIIEKKIGLRTTFGNKHQGLDLTAYNERVYDK